jgi:ABC-type phosphate transport system permease subunit
MMIMWCGFEPAVRHGKTSKMSILSHGFERPTRKAGLRRLVLGALTMLSMGSVLTALIALKTAIYVWHLHA